MHNSTSTKQYQISTEHWYHDQTNTLMRLQEVHVHSGKVNQGHSQGPSKTQRTNGTMGYMQAKDFSFSTCLCAVLRSYCHDAAV